MPNLDWSALFQKGRLKLATYGEYFAKMELASYGLDVYTSEVDDQGIDFVCLKGRKLLKIQVKSVLKTTTVYMRRQHFDITDPNLFLFLLVFRQGEFPNSYLIPATDWQTETSLLRYRSYDKPGLKSQPEYALNLSKKNAPLLQPYELARKLADLTP